MHQERETESALLEGGGVCGTGSTGAQQVGFCGMLLVVAVFLDCIARSHQQIISVKNVNVVGSAITLYFWWRSTLSLIAPQARGPRGRAADVLGVPGLPRDQQEELFAGVRGPVLRVRRVRGRAAARARRAAALGAAAA